MITFRRLPSESAATMTHSNLNVCIALNRHHFTFRRIMNHLWAAILLPYKWERAQDETIPSKSTHVTSLMKNAAEDDATYVKYCMFMLAWSIWDSPIRRIRRLTKARNMLIQHMESMLPSRTTQYLWFISCLISVRNSCIPETIQLKR